MGIVKTVLDLRVRQGAGVSYPLIWRVTETKARIASQDINYTGAVRMVGAGQTYATLTAAAAAANDLDILQLVDGTLQLSAESGGYWLINNNAKRLLVRGNTSNKGAVVINHSTATYGIRMRDCNSLTFENITFTSDQNYNNGIITMEAYSLNNYFKAKNCVFTNTNAGTSARIFNRASTIAGTNSVHIEFDNCTFNVVGTNSPVTYTSAGINEKIIYKSCTFNTKSFAINYSSLNHGTIAVYDSNFVIESTSAAAIQVGENTNSPTHTDFIVDIRNNTFSYINNTFDHGLLAGRGTNKIYCVNNTFTSPAVDNGNNMAIVIKTIAAVAGNAYFAGNYATSARPVYIKGGKNCILKYNTAVSNVATWESLSVLNPASDLLSTGNIVTQNNFIGGDKSIKCYPSSGFDSAATSLKTCTLDYNNYYSSSNWLVDDVTNYAFAQKGNFWINSNDANSKLLTRSTLGAEKTITDDTIIN